MGVIKILEESVSNIIAAGEVVENPTAMLKELLENSLDAGSSSILIEVKEGGRYLNISDNGKGMVKEDLLMCVERHATSKIAKKEDLFNLHTYGFRGEALASICAVSKVRISSAIPGGTGNSITVSAGKITSLKEYSMGQGTSLEIRDLFFNTPARLKFLRKNITEYSNIKDVVIQEALANPNVGISLLIEGRESVKTSGNGLENSIVEIFGKNILKNLVKTDVGYVGNTTLSRSTKDSIFTFVNKRVVKSKVIEDALIDVYYTKLDRGKYPFGIIFIDVDPGEIDVNVHPSKKIIKFSDENYIYSKIKQAVFEKISGTDILTTEHDLAEKISDFKECEKESVIDRAVEKEFTLEDENISRKNILPLASSINRSFNFSDEPFDFILKNNKSEKEEVETIEVSAVEEKKNNYSINNENQKKNSENFRIIGQYSQSYIIVEKDGDLEIYDQHIVHERILYEKLKKDILGKNISSQVLLVPQRLNIDPRNKDFIRENLIYFNEFGFEVEFFGEKELLIRSIPVFDFRENLKNVFEFLLEELKENRQQDPRESIIISMSCKGAIKAGEKLENYEMEKLIKDLHLIGEYTCPHGRPIILRFPLVEIEKKFKRR